VADPHPVGDTDTDRAAHRRSRASDLQVVADELAEANRSTRATARQVSEEAQRARSRSRALRRAGDDRRSTALDGLLDPGHRTGR
jgi:hypothetical protein